MDCVLSLLLPPHQRRITAVDESERHQYHHVQVIQLVVFTLEIVQAIWCMPWDHRAKWSRQALQAPQISLFDRFADYIVQIRIEEARTLHTSQRRTVFGSTANTRTVARMPNPSATHTST